MQQDDQRSQSSHFQSVIYLSKKKKKLNGNFDYHIPGSDFKRITHILKYQHEAVLYLGLKCLDLDL